MDTCLMTCRHVGKICENMVKNRTFYPVTTSMSKISHDKDFQYYNKEKEEEHRQQRYNYEKHI